MASFVKTKSLQKVIDYKLNFKRRLVSNPNHRDSRYLKFFSADYMRQGIEDNQFIEFIRIYKNEWPHYYEENFPEKSLAGARKKFVALRKKARINPELPYAEVIIEASKGR